MKVNAERCWSGGCEYHWRLELRVRGEYVRLNVAAGEDARWDRDAATRALDMLESWYSVNRRSVRFNVR